MKLDGRLLRLRVSRQPSMVNCRVALRLSQLIDDLHLDGPRRFENDLRIRRPFSRFGAEVDSSGIVVRTEGEQHRTMRVFPGPIELEVSAEVCLGLFLRPIFLVPCHCG
jgi:hypothetical protein